jgi:hypothetical protein
MRIKSSYTTYSIGCAVAWALLWLVLGLAGKTGTKESVLIFFLGWVVGWTSATIARRVYPPPPTRRSS